jgi:hypothetical protein
MILTAPLFAAVLSLILVKISSLSFSSIFMINIWLLSVPHSFATFLRSDLRSFKHFSKSFLLYFAFFILLVYASYKSGMVAVFSFYFYWQQFHYSQQNLGIGRKMQKQPGTLWVDKVFYLSVTAIAVAGLFNGEGEVFFGYKLFNVFPFSIGVIGAFSINLICLIAYMLYKGFFDKMAVIHTAIFSLCYLLPENFAEGWLYLNIFHNTQYLFFMKSFERNLFFYLNAILVTCFFYILYYLANKYGMMLYSFPITIFMLLALNFSHYVFDGVIWKKRAI